MGEDNTTNMAVIVKDMLRNYYDLDTTSKIDLDRAIQSLIDCETLVGDDLIIMQLIIEGANYREISKIINRNTRYVSTRFNDLAQTLADELGDEYQDTVILKRVSDKLGRPLTSDEEKFCWKVIRSGQSLGDGLSILNFKVGKRGRITKRDED